VSPTTVRLTIGDGTAASWHDTFLPSWQSTIVKADGFNVAKPIGAGPFTLTSFTEAKEATYARSDSYWDADAITLGGIELVQIANEQVESGTAALQAGQVDISLTSPAQMPALTGDLELYTQADPNQTVSMMMCKASGPLTDSRVRKAINMALDRESISAAVYADTAEPAQGMWPAGHRFSSPELEEELSYDVDAAKALMTEAGFGDGFDINLYSVGVFNLPEAAEVIKEQLEVIGIDVTITVAANFVGEYLGVNAPGLGLFPGSNVGVEKLNQWSGEALVNTCDFDDPELNQVKIDLRRVTQSSDEAVALWHDANEIVVGEALSGFVLFRSVLAGYNTETIGAVSLWPKGSVITPKPRETWMNPS
jgi:peptide/nickel transport system substrate-binding protein